MKEQCGFSWFSDALWLSVFRRSIILLIEWIWFYPLIIGFCSEKFRLTDEKINAMNRRMTITRNISHSLILCAACFLLLAPAILKAQNPEAISDVDGNVYQCVKIGNQLWMKENLKVGHYRNGDPIPTELVDTTWAKTKTGAYSIYNNDTIQHRIFGKLYNGFAVVDPRGLCLAGWHVPSDDDWKELELFLGMPLKKFKKFGTRGAKENIAGKMKATGNLKDGSGLWMNYDKDANNETGFSGLPGGHRKHRGTYSFLGEAGSWWTSTVHSQQYRFSSWYRLLDYNRRIYRDAISMNFGFSVRCLKD